MTPQERAAAVYRQLNDGLYWLREDRESHHAQEAFGVGLLLKYAQDTRRAALLEAAEVAEKRKNDSALGRVRDAYSYVEANLRKLAQEG